jgi:hypothetical protein
MIWLSQISISSCRISFARKLYLPIRWFDGGITRLPALIENPLDQSRVYMKHNHWVAWVLIWQSGRFLLIACEVMTLTPK